MLTAMAPKTRPAPKRATTKPAPTPRAKSKLSEIGEEAMRRALLESLVTHDWQLTKVAEALRMGGAANVLRSVRALGLTAAYDVARARGAIRPGPRAK